MMNRLLLMIGSTQLELLDINNLIVGIFDLLEKRNNWKFLVAVSGHGLIQERKSGSDEVLEFEVFGNEIEENYMLYGYIHNIINLLKRQNLVTAMWANELFNPEHPDTFLKWELNNASDYYRSGRLRMNSCRSGLASGCCEHSAFFDD